jgi:hypothetical protein
MSEADIRIPDALVQSENPQDGDRAVGCLGLAGGHHAYGCHLLPLVGLGKCVLVQFGSGSACTSPCGMLPEFAQERHRWIESARAKRPRRCYLQGDDREHKWQLLGMLACLVEGTNCSSQPA